MALITGAARGIGRVMARSFAEEGTAVVIADLEEAAGEAVTGEIRREGGQALFIKTDLRQEMDIRAMVEATVKAFTRLDVLINNARPRLQRLPFAESLEEWDLAMAVLLKAPVLAAKYAFPHLAASGGSIINIGSTNAFFISHQPAAYHVAKAGLVQLTRYLAQEFGPQGVRVNCICPGLVDVPDAKTPLTSDPVNKAVTELIVPLQRAASPEDIARAALFLSTTSSAYLTGQVLTIDGGVTAGDHFHAARRAFRLAAEQRKDEGSVPSAHRSSR